MASLRITQEDHGRKVEVESTSGITLELAENPSSGFLWELHDIDSEVIAAGESRFAPKSAKTGAPGVRTFQLQPVKAGTTPLRAKLWRKWEGDSSIAERFEVSVHVQESVAG